MEERVPNIGPQGQRTRLQGGLVSLAVGAAATLFLIFSGGSRWWRLLLFIPFWQGALGVFQAREKTWVYLAARGLRDLNGGETKIEDPAELAQVRRQARKVHGQAILSGIVLALLTFILPRKSLPTVIQNSH